MTGRFARRATRLALLPIAMATLVACGEIAATSSEPSATPPPTTSSAPPGPSVSTGITEDQDGWSTYTNTGLGFRVRFPTRINAASGAPCVGTGTGGERAFGPAAGVVPATVIANFHTFWVTQQTAYLPTKPEARGDKGVLYRDCTETAISTGLLISEADAMADLASALGFTVDRAADEAAVRKRVRTVYSCPDLEVGFAASSKAWTEVSIACPGAPSTLGEPSLARWYPEQRLFVLFTLGQFQAIRTAQGRPVGQEIADSFAPLG